MNSSGHLLDGDARFWLLNHRGETESFALILWFWHLIVTPTSSLWPSRAARIQNHWKGDQLNICSPVTPAALRGFSILSSHPSPCCHDFHQFSTAAFSNARDVTQWVASWQDSSSAGVNQPRPAESTSWRFSSKLASQCLRFHRVQIQPHFFNLVGFFELWFAVLMCF